MFLTPPLAVPDENTHFINAYAISEGHFFADVANGQVGISMPKAYADFINGNKDKYKELNGRQSFKNYYYDSWLKQDLSQKTFYITPLRMDNPIGHLIAGLGMALCAFLLRSYALPYNLLLFGRLFNLLFYIAVVYNAIRITPYFKRTMLLLSVMPMSMFLAASLSYDAIIISAAFLLFAYIVKLNIASEAYVVTKKDIAAVIFIAFFIGGIKPVYLPLLFVFLAAPIRKSVLKKRYFAYLSVALLAGVSVYFIPALINRFLTHGITLSGNQYAALQKAYLYSHLSAVPSIITETFKRFSGFYITGIFGILGQLDTNFPVPVMVVFYILLAVVVVSDSCKAKNISGLARIFSAIAVIISVLMIYYYEYTTWTALPNILGVGAHYISGVQGRYYIPVVLFLCLLLSNSLYYQYPLKLFSGMNKKIDAVTLFSGAVFGTLTVTTVLLRFWCD